VVIHALGVDRRLAGHPSPRRTAGLHGLIAPGHWEDLPGGHTRAAVIEPAHADRSGGTVSTPTHPGPLVGLVAATARSPFGAPAGPNAPTGGLCASYSVHVGVLRVVVVAGE
jgi:hypothetical protein